MERKKKQCCHWCSYLEVVQSGHCFHILEVTATGIIISEFLLFSLSISGEFDAALASKIQNHTEMNTLRTTEYFELQGTHKDHPV